MCSTYETSRIRLALSGLALSCTGRSIGCGTARIVLVIGLGLEGRPEDAVLTRAEDGAPQHRQWAAESPGLALADLHDGRPVVGKPVLLRLREPPREASGTRRTLLLQGRPVVRKPVLQVLWEPPGQARLARRTEWVDRNGWGVTRHQHGQKERRRPGGQQRGQHHLDDGGAGVMTLRKGTPSFGTPWTKLHDLQYN